MESDDMYRVPPAGARYRGPIDLGAAGDALSPPASYVPEDPADAGESTVWRRLDVLQHRQQLVDQLQAELASCRRRCAELEQRRGDEHRLAELENRCAALSDVNSLLRGQLHSAQEENEALTAELGQLTAAWQRQQQQLQEADSAHEREERTFSAYYSAEHSRLLLLWKEMVDFRRQFGELRSSTQLDLGRMQSELGRCVRESVDVCAGLVSTSTLLQTSEIIYSDSKVHQTTSETMWEAVDALQHQEAAGRAEKRHLENRVHDLSAQLERCSSELAQKDKMVESMNQVISTLKSNSVELNSKLDQQSVVESQLHSLRQSVREVVELIAEDSSRWSTASEVGDSSSDGIPILVNASSVTRSPRSCSSDAVAAASAVDGEETVAVVRSALHRRHLQLHGLQVKLAGVGEQLAAARRWTAEQEQRHELVEQQVEKVREEQLTAEVQRDEVRREVTRKQQGMDSLNVEHRQLKEHCAVLNQQMSEMMSLVETRQKEMQRVQVRCDAFEEDLQTTTAELDRTKTRLEESRWAADEKDDKNENLNRMVTALKEDVHKHKLDYDILAKDNCIVLESLAKVKLDKEELDARVSRLTATESGLKNALLKITNQNEGLSTDRRDLHQLAQQLSAEQALLKSERAALEAEVSGLREQLARLEQDKSRIVTEKFNLHETLSRTDTERAQLEDQLSELRSDCAESESRLGALARQRDALQDELARTRLDYEQAKADMNRSANDQELLAKSAGELEARNAAMQADILALRESLAVARADCLHLEMQVYETRSGLEAAEVTRMHLQEETRQLTAERDEVHARLATTQRAMNTEVEKLAVDGAKLRQNLEVSVQDKEKTVAHLNTAHGEMVVRLKREKDEAVEELENRLRKSVQSWTLEQDEMMAKKETTIQGLYSEIDRLTRLHESQLLAAEETKQQALSMAMDEQKVAQNALKHTKEELDKCRTELLKLKTESSTQSQSSRTQISALQTEVTRLKEQLDSKSLTREKEISALSGQLKDMQKMRETADNAMAQVKVQLGIAEERRGRLERELTDVARKLQDVEAQRDKAEESIVTCKKTIQEVRSEIATLEGTNVTLREKIKEGESDKSKLKRSWGDEHQLVVALTTSKEAAESDIKQLRVEVQETDRAKQSVIRECEELKRQQYCLESRHQDDVGEITELQSKLTKEREASDANKGEIFSLQQQLAELEGTCAGLKNELADMERLLSESDDKLHWNEQELTSTLDENKESAKRLDEENKSLQIRLSASSQEANEFRLKLMSLEGRNQSLEEQLARLETTKREADAKLSSIHSSLLRIPGLRVDGGGSVASWRSPSPARRALAEKATASEFRPARDVDTVPHGEFDVDPQLLRSGLEDLMKQLSQLRRQRDDALNQAQSSDRELKNARFSLAECQRRLDETKERLNSISAEKHLQDSKLSTFVAEAVNRDENMKHKDIELATLLDKVARMERTVSQLTSDRQRLEEKLGALRRQEAQLEDDKRSARQRSEDQESRLTQLETVKRSVEADLQRCQVLVQDRAAVVETLTGRLEAAHQVLQAAEAHSAQLGLNMERLTRQLVAVDSSEGEAKQQVASLSHQLAESGAQLAHERDKFQQCQRQLLNVEQERSIADEKLSALMKINAELKRHNEEVVERNGALQRQVTDERLSRSQVELEIRARKQEHEHRSSAQQDLIAKIHALEMEKTQLADSLAVLQRKIGAMEAERKDLEDGRGHLEKDRTALMQALDKVECERLKMDETAHRSSRECTSLGQTLSTVESRCLDLQHRNTVLEQQVSALEDQLVKQQRMSSGARTLTGDDADGHRQSELERLRVQYVKLERSMEARQRQYRQRLAGLEQQVETLKQQLIQETRKRLTYIARSSRTGQEIRQIRSTLDDSLRHVSSAEPLDSVLLDAELRRLDSTVDRHSEAGTAPRRRPGQVRSRTVSPRSPRPRAINTLSTAPSPAVRTSRRGSAMR